MTDGRLSVISPPSTSVSALSRRTFPNGRDTIPGNTPAQNVRIRRTKRAESSQNAIGNWSKTLSGTVRYARSFKESKRSRDDPYTSVKKFLRAFG